MSKRNSKFMTKVVAIALAMVMVFSDVTVPISAASYSGPLQEVKFGDAYSGTLSESGAYGYQVNLSSPGVVRANVHFLRMKSYGDLGWFAKIRFYDENYKCYDSETIIVGNYYSYFDVNLEEGTYYFEVAASDVYGDCPFEIFFTYSAFSNVSVKSVKNNKKKSVKVKWKKNAKAKGYDVQLAKNKSFTKGVRSFRNLDKKYTSVTFTGLKKKKTYYARVRSYVETLTGTVSYSKWSAAKSVKIRK